MGSTAIDVEVSARLCAAIDGMTVALGQSTAAMEREYAWRQKVAQVIRQVPFAGTITLSAGAGTEDQPDKLTAKTGYIWSIRRLTAQGYSAGTVTAYRNSTVGEPIAPFPSAAVNVFSRGEMMLMSGDRLVWGATGITGTVSYYGVADCFESWYLPFYIG